MYNEGESLLNILEEAQKSTLSSQKASDADGAAIALIGNASAHMSKESRKKILKELNIDLVPLASRSLLFGGLFEKR